MRKLTEYPILSLKERDRRWALVRKEMEARGLDCLVLFGWPSMWDFNIANARYLCPIGGNAENNVLVFPLSGEPTSFIYSPVFTDYWKGAQSWVADVRPRKDQPFYHLLAENSETEYIAYVSEQNLLEDQSGEPVRHPQIKEMFDKRPDGRYEPKRQSRH